MAVFGVYQGLWGGGVFNGYRGTVTMETQQWENTKATKLYSWTVKMVNFVLRDFLKSHLSQTWQWLTQEEEYFTMWKLYETQILMSTDEVLLKHSHIYLFMDCPWLFSSCHYRDHIVSKLELLTIWPFDRKSLPAPRLDEGSVHVLSEH
jgi:hypothetical protein